MTAKPIRVVSTVSVGQTPEGVKMSPDGNYVAVTVMNGSNKPSASPFFNDFGLLKVYRIFGHRTCAGGRREDRPLVPGHGVVEGLQNIS